MANPSAATRRRSPGWVRAFSSPSLHGLLGKFDRMRQSSDLSEQQEWLYDACVSELEYRRRVTRPIWKCCSCRYCVPPFPD